MTKPALAATAALLLGAQAAEAHKLPLDYAKSEAVQTTKRFWKDDGFYVLERPTVSKCRRYSRHKIRCKTSVYLEDRYGCGRATGLVSVRYLSPSSTRVFGKLSRSVFFPFYDPARSGYDARSCTAYGF